MYACSSIFACACVYLIYFCVLIIHRRRDAYNDDGDNDDDDDGTYVDVDAKKNAAFCSADCDETSSRLRNTQTSVIVVTKIISTKSTEKCVRHTYRARLCACVSARAHLCMCLRLSATLCV